MPFNPKRLGIARKLRMLNKTAFAQMVGVTDRTLLRWDQGTTVPTEETVEACAKALGFPRAFFSEMILRNRISIRPVLGANLL